MSNAKKIEFYICTGGSGIYYTLRKVAYPVLEAAKPLDTFVKNLATSEPGAIESAIAYTEALKAASQGEVEIILDKTPREKPINTWGDGKLSPARIAFMRDVTNGIMPYGMHQKKAFTEIPSDYLAWACKEALTKNDLVTQNVASAAFCVLLDRNEIKTKADINALTQAKENHNKLSDFFGTVKERVTILGAKIEYLKKDQNSHYNRPSYFYKIRFGNDVLVYSGSTFLGGVDDKINIKATIDKHVNYHGTKSTFISRPYLA